MTEKLAAPLQFVLESFKRFSEWPVRHPELKTTTIQNTRLGMLIGLVC